MMNSIAIVLVCFKRLDGIKRLLGSLEKVDFDDRKDITLIFSVDYADDNKNVIQFAKDYEWRHGEKIVRTFSENQGLKKHILGCGDLTEQYDTLVVLEDDLYVSPAFYHFVQGAAEYYRYDDNIAGISLYSFNKNWLNTIYEFCPQKDEFDTYFLKVAQSWGQIWIKEKWREFKKWYENNEEFLNSDKIPKPLNLWSSKSSWLKYFDRYCIETGKYFVYPYYSITTNFSDAGTHSSVSSTDSQVRLQWNKKNFLFAPFNENAVIYDEFMEREFRTGIDDIPWENLSIDLYCNKNEKYYARFILTPRVLNYKVLRSYKLAIKPIEQSIYDCLDGNDIFLYDSSVKMENSKKEDKYLLLRYSSGISTFQKSKIMLKYSFFSVVRSIYEKIAK